MLPIISAEQTHHTIVPYQPLEHGEVTTDSNPLLKVHAVFDFYLLIIQHVCNADIIALSAACKQTRDDAHFYKVLDPNIWSLHTRLPWNPSYDLAAHKVMYDEIKIENPHFLKALGGLREAFELPVLKLANDKFEGRQPKPLISDLTSRVMRGVGPDGSPFITLCYTVTSKFTAERRPRLAVFYKERNTWACEPALDITLNVRKFCIDMRSREIIERLGRLFKGQQVGVAILSGSPSKTGLASAPRKHNCTLQTPPYKEDISKNANKICLLEPNTSRLSISR